MIVYLQSISKNHLMQFNNHIQQYVMQIKLKNILFLMMTIKMIKIIIIIIKILNNQKINRVFEKNKKFLYSLNYQN